MAIVLDPEVRPQALASLGQFCDRELELELSEIQVASLLDFFLKEIAPSVYNGAVADARTFLVDRLADMEATLFEGEFTYWPKGKGPRLRQK